MKIDRSKWKPCLCYKPSCTTCINMDAWDRYGKPIVCLKCENNSNYDPDDNYCSECGRPLTEQAWKELERRVFAANEL